MDEDDVIFLDESAAPQQMISRNTQEPMKESQPDVQNRKRGGPPMRGSGSGGRNSRSGGGGGRGGDRSSSGGRGGDRGNRGGGLMAMRFDRSERMIGGGEGGRHPYYQQNQMDYDQYSDGMPSYGGPNKRMRQSFGQGPEGRVFEKLMNLHGPSADLPPKKFEIKKFMANTRLYVGNLASDLVEDDIRELFKPFGELDEIFHNKEKNFAFLKLDYRFSAENARAELDQKMLKGKSIKVRFAPAMVRVRVKNLNPMVSNELLEIAFSVFGDVERAVVYADEKGRSLSEGFVDFTRKNNAQFAHKFCTEKCFFLTSDLRPVLTEMGEMHEVDEGVTEQNLPKNSMMSMRRYGKSDMDGNSYYKARELGPRIADEGSFEHSYGKKWKELVESFKEKEKALNEEKEKEIAKLESEMVSAKYDHETEMLRKQLKQRETEWEMRGQHGQQQQYDFRGNRQQSQQQYDSRNAGPRSLMENLDFESNNYNNNNNHYEQYENVEDSYDEVRSGIPSLIPPPIPPMLTSGPAWGNPSIFGHNSGYQNSSSSESGHQRGQHRGGGQNRGGGGRGGRGRGDNYKDPNLMSISRRR